MPWGVPRERIKTDEPVYRFELRAGAIATDSPQIATALLVDGHFWGSRERGPKDELLPAGKLSTVDKFYNAATGKVRVVFVIAGDPQKLRMRRAMFHYGAVWIDKREFKKKCKELLELVAYTEKEAIKNMGGKANAIT